MRLLDIFEFAYHALAANKVRTLLTALGLVIGNAAVIWVVTISLVSRDLILEQIRVADGAALAIQQKDVEFHGHGDFLSRRSDGVKKPGPKGLSFHVEPPMGNLSEAFHVKRGEAFLNKHG